MGTTSLPLCMQLQNIMMGLDRSVPLMLNTTFGTAGMLIVIILYVWWLRRTIHYSSFKADTGRLGTIVFFLSISSVFLDFLLVTKLFTS